MAETRQEPVLQLEQVVKKYAVSGKELMAVNSVSLTVQQGKSFRWAMRAVRAAPGTTPVSR